MGDHPTKSRWWQECSSHRPQDVGSESKSYFRYSLRTQWLYTEWDEGKQGRELYDHAVDSHELVNLADKPEHSKTVELLSEQLRAAAKSTFPESGKTPMVGTALWPPNLTAP